MSRIEKLISENWNTIKFITLVVALLGAFISFDNYINNQIEERITDSNYINRLSKSLRPFLVFNDQGIVLYDHGADEFIEKIDIDDQKNTVTIKFKKFFQNAPLLTVASAATQYLLKTERKRDNVWGYSLSTPTHQTLSIKGVRVHKKYILELLK